MTQNPVDSTSMTALELRAALTLAVIYFMRLLGLFMVLPVFALHADAYAGATPLLIGLALGAYGITQALLQVPFGTLSDRYGRKPVIVGGLALFSVGSLVAAVAPSIGWVIAGRALQGAGAISAAIMALAADLTRENQRAKAMAVIGISIGFSFAVAFIVGPALDGVIGISGIFWVSGLLGVIAILVLKFWVPDPTPRVAAAPALQPRRSFASILHDPALMRLNVGILSLHAILTASFVVLPLELRDGAGIAQGDHWLVYLPVLALSVIIVLPLVRLAETRARLRPLFLCAIALLAVVEFGLVPARGRIVPLVLLLLCYFTAFNVLEAILPALVSRLAPPERKGSALGVYATSQFIGAAVGGAVGGWLHGVEGVSAVFVFCGALASVWLLIAVPMKIRTADHANVST